MRYGANVGKPYYKQGETKKVEKVEATKPIEKPEPKVEEKK